MPDAQLAYLLLHNGALQSVAFSEGEAMATRSSDDIEVAEWPVKPLRPLPGGLYEYATEHIATDTADLGKLTSIDTLMEIAFIVRGREGWKCINVLPGLFGEKCFPPGVTMVWGREKRVGMGLEDWQESARNYFNGIERRVRHTQEASLDSVSTMVRASDPWPIGPDPAGETA